MELGEEQKRTLMATPQREIFALQRNVHTCTYIAKEYTKFLKRQKTYATYIGRPRNSCDVGRDRKFNF
jgi:hypothetical protein